MTKKGFSIQKDKLEGLWMAKRAGCVFLRMKKVLQRWDGCPFTPPFASAAAKGGCKKNAAVTMCHGGVFMSSGGD